MYKIKNSIIILLTVLISLFSVISCKDLDELNINPNGVDPETADLNLLMATFLLKVGDIVVDLGFGDIAGVMQHTQYDGWPGSHNNYDWDNDSHSWSGYYSALRNIDEFYSKAVENDYEFHQGVGLIMKCYVFGLITDLWGDAPYSEALQGEDGSSYYQPVFDDQEDIYNGILEDLETANTLLSKSSSEYDNISSTQDVLFGGDVEQWQKFANSLALRYYMRLSEKEPDVAKEGISKIYSDSETYPIITSSNDDANLDYVGGSEDDAWPSSVEYNTSSSGTYYRNKMCATLVDTLQAFDDPRLAVWASKIEIPLVLVSGTGVDEIEDGVRYISQDVADEFEETYGVTIDYDSDYVGIPPSITAAQYYNLNPNLDQGVYNPHCSQLDSMYMESTGDLLQMRLLSAAEVNFILAEAASYGWISASAEEYYIDGIQQSFNAWGVDEDAESYAERAPYTGLESIIEQKWISSWTAAAESWFDWRRTGLPDLQTGEEAKRVVLPLRLYYHYDDEISVNTENANAAIEKLEATDYIGTDESNNSAWSRMWLLQGTGIPY